jgi:hypothetical protein
MDLPWLQRKKQNSLQSHSSVHCLKVIRVYFPKHSTRELVAVVAAMQPVVKEEEVSQLKICPSGFPRGRLPFLEDKRLD